MKTYILPFILVFFIQISFSQTIKGIVLDAKTEQPISGVHVYLSEGDNTGVVTNEKGKYKLVLPLKTKKNSTIHFSHIGYTNKEMVYYKNEKKYSTYLLGESLELDEVELLSKKKLKSRLYYNKLAPMENKLFSFGSLLVDDKIYVFGGDKSYKVDALNKAIDDYSGLDLGEIIAKTRFHSSYQFYSDELSYYDIKSNKWNTEPLKLRKRAYHNTVYNPSNDKIYVLGGKRLSTNRAFEYLDDKIEVYDPNNNSIEIDNTNPHQAINAASFVYKDKIIVMGGSIKKKKNGKIIYSKKVHVFDTKTGLWYALNDMPTAKELNGVLVKDKIYVFGGYNGKTLNGIESYNLTTGKWKKEGELFSNLSSPAIAKDGDIIYLFENGKMFSYNTETQDLKKYAIGLYLNASKMFIVDYKIYILGGNLKDEFSTTPSRNLYAVNLNEFNTTKINKAN